jgi:hypothetical protein
MAYRVVAQGTNIWDLQRTVSNMNLTKGTRIKVEMETNNDWIARAFDAYGAELLFSPFVPDGCALIDVHSDGTKGVVELEADPVILDDLLVFIAAHWLGILILGITLAVIVAAIIVAIEVPNTVAISGAIVIAIVAALYILTTPGRSIPKWQAK